uniref:Uncharacterized protein n=1 Tax=Marseillevirus sp. TaxID=2809551 RepID=A0AA96ER23_9VIRU|nr:hypothetical protein MarFTMF_041 [Marseillevirus sp.]
MSLTSEFEMDGDDFNGVKFTYSDGVVEFEFCGYLWDIEETKERFGRFLRNAKNGELSIVEFENSNGDSSITHKNGRIHFNVSKYGGNGSGDLSVTLPLELCIPALENLSS